MTYLVILHLPMEYLGKTRGVYDIHSLSSLFYTVEIHTFGVFSALSLLALD